MFKRDLLKKDFLLPLFIILVLAGGLVVYNLSTSRLPRSVETEKPKAVVYKSPNCGCCANYVVYLKRWGFEVEVKDLSDKELREIKNKYQIPPGFESCHTTIIGDYAVEGHVPIEAINQLLTEKPAILGIGLPGMPPGAPGMGGGKSGVFEIYQFDKINPTPAVFRRI